jgi:hypothetical protein
MDSIRILYIGFIFSGKSKVMVVKSDVYDCTDITDINSLIKTFIANKWLNYDNYSQNVALSSGIGFTLLTSYDKNHVKLLNSISKLLNLPDDYYYEVFPPDDNKYNFIETLVEQEINNINYDYYCDLLESNV